MLFESRLVVIDMLRLALTKVSFDDDLLEFLEQYGVSRVKRVYLDYGGAIIHLSPFGF